MVRPDGAIPLPAKPDVGGVADEATRPPGEGEAATGVEDGGGGAREGAPGATLISLRFKSLSKPQSLGTCLGSSRWQIGQIPLPPKDCFHRVLIPLSPYDLQSQSKGEFQTVPALLVWVDTIARTQDGGLEDLSPWRGSLRMKE
jgi:hypothetical protein